MNKDVYITSSRDSAENSGKCFSYCDFAINSACLESFRAF